MVENYEEKKANGMVDLEFAESGNILILERRFDQVTGVPVFVPTQETSVKHIDDLREDLQAQIAPVLQKIANLEALRPDVEAKEAERAALVEEKFKLEKEEKKK